MKIFYKGGYLLYTIRLQKTKKAKSCRTIYTFDCGEKARDFANGYNAALRDLNFPLIVHVYEDTHKYYTAGE